MELGEHIELVGFSDDAAEIIIIKKLVGNHVKHFTERVDGFERLVLTRKEIHANQHDVHGRLLIAGKEFFAEDTDYNLFFALDNCLKKLENQAR